VEIAKEVKKVKAAYTLGHHGGQNYMSYWLAGEVLG
jgi:hypothetical protein